MKGEKLVVFVDGKIKGAVQDLTVESWKPDVITNALDKRLADKQISGYLLVISTGGGVQK